MAKSVIGTTSKVCEGSGAQSKFPAGSKSPCPQCGHNTTTKRDGVLRNHAPKKQKTE